MAQSQLDKLVRGPREPAYRYARRVIVLATAAAVAGEDIDLKAQRALEVTGPKLRKSLEKPGCTFAELVKVAELTESRNLLKRDDPVMTKYISDVSEGSNPVRSVGTEGRDNSSSVRVEVSDGNNSSDADTNRWADVTCYRCGVRGHIRPKCTYTGPDLHLGPTTASRGTNEGSDRGGGNRRATRGRNNRGSSNNGGNRGNSNTAPRNSVP
jgi:hypothetical protein